MSKKKVKAKKKISTKKISKTNRKQPMKKTHCDTKPVRPVNEFYNVETGEIYPKIFFRTDSLWDKIKRFFGFIP